MGIANPCENLLLHTLNINSNVTTLKTLSTCMKMLLSFAIPVLWRGTGVGVICLLFCTHLHAQSVTGKVLEINGNPLPQVNVLLLNSADSSLVRGAVADTLGKYAFYNLSAGTYLLSASMMGYQQGYLPPFTFVPSAKPRQLDNLALSEDTRELNEVMVVEKRPFVEQYIDRTVVNVANSIIASGATALEVLEKAPGVTVDRQNDNIALRGKEGVLVQINGRTTYLEMPDLVALLRNTPSDNIDNIELITNPSARYDAAGNAGIINIRLKKNNNVGTNGSVSLAAGSGRYDRERGSLQLNHRTRLFNLFGNYSANQGGSYWDFERHGDWSENGERNLIDQENYLHFWDWGHNAKAGIDFFLGKNTTLGLIWTGIWSSRKEKGPTETYFRNAPEAPVYLHTHTDKTWESIANNQVGNVNFQHTFGEKGGQLTADFDIGRFHREFENTLLTNTVFSENPEQPQTGLLTQMPTTIDVRTAKVDYNRQLKNNWKLEAGYKNSYVNSDNNMTLYQGEAGNLQYDSALSNHFQYTEQVNAAYASIAGKLGTTDLLAGLRAEHTHSVGNSLTLNERVERDYLNFFPSLFLTRPLNPNHTLTFSYSYRIDRPNYQTLNPARGYVDPYAFSRGNPDLKPQYTHSLELKHGWRNMVYTSVGASYTTDLVFFLIQPVDPKRFERTPENVGDAQSYNLTVSFPLTIMKGWTLQTTLMGIYSQFDYTYLDIPLTARQVSGRLNASNAFVLGKGWTAELGGWLSTPSVNVIVHSPWLGSLDAGVQKAWGTQWKLKLSVQDIFHTNRIIGDIDEAGFSNQVRIAFDTRVAMLNLTYSFGNQQLKGTRQRKTGSEEEIRRTN
jgi:outer membrane receptor protein involved in Fe transport